MPRLLLVEDDTHQALSLARDLRVHGYDVLVAFDVPTAEHLLRHRSLDVVLCDLFLPPQSGLDVLDVINREHLALRFILMSGQRAEESDWIQRKHPRITAFVPKPCPLRRILEALERAQSP